jgi:3-dehydroquinate dehydratase-1
MGEIRLDLARLSGQEVAELFSGPLPLVATCRPGRMDDRLRTKALLEAMEAGARYVDVELEADPVFRRAIRDQARARGCQVIISRHDFSGTPSREVLSGWIDACFEAGADVAKIACQVRSPAESARLLGLLDGARPLVVIGMGALGRITRVVAPLLGSPFTFAAPGPGDETAPGQMDRASLQALLYELGRMA